MAINQIPSPADILNSSEIFSSAWSSLPPELLDKMNLLFTIGKVILILTLLYLVIVIIVQLMKFRDSSNLSIIAKQTTEINEKLSLLLEHKSKKPKADKKKSNN